MTPLDAAPHGSLPRAASLGRVAAGLALASAVVHLLLVDVNSLGSLVMVGMALACLPCAWHLWWHATPGVWGTTAAVDAGMIVLHLPMLATVTHHASGAQSAPHSLMWAGLAIVTSQLALAGAAALRR
jgi:hypothetical protein